MEQDTERKSAHATECANTPAGRDTNKRTILLRFEVTSDLMGRYECWVVSL
jgi:hypothetical protein